VVGCTIGSREEVPGERRPVIKSDEKDDMIVVMMMMRRIIISEIFTVASNKKF
jgi:hypothetical protein